MGKSWLGELILPRSVTELGRIHLLLGQGDGIVANRASSQPNRLIG